MSHECRAIAKSCKCAVEKKKPVGCGQCFGSMGSIRSRQMKRDKQIGGWQELGGGWELAA